jgi:hypothetical protein
MLHPLNSALRSQSSAHRSLNSAHRAKTAARRSQGGKHASIWGAHRPQTAALRPPSPKARNQTSTSRSTRATAALPFVPTRKRGDPRLRRCLAGRLVGVEGAPPCPGLPLAMGKGMASMSEAAGRVAQPPGLGGAPQSSPAAGGAANNEARPGTASAAPRAAAPGHQTAGQPQRPSPGRGRQTEYTHSK